MLAARQFIFLWPAMLGLLVAVPLLVAYYFRLLARSRLAALRLPGLAARSEFKSGTAPRSALGRLRSHRLWAGLRRHSPAMLMLIGITALILAIARPQAIIMLPSHLETIMLAIDTSGSMRATDIKPTRMAAAKAAARAFVANQPGRVRIGIVTMAATAAVALSPTDNRGDIDKAIDRLQTQPGTALGSGLVIALTTLLPEGGIDAQKIISGADAPSAPRVRDWARETEIANFKPLPPGSNGAAAVVMLSDGQSNTGPELLDAAKLAAERGVRVYTVGVGTPEGITLVAEGWSMRVRLDEETLRKVSTLTLGEYYRAGNDKDLKAIYERLSARLSLGRGRTTEITAVFVAAGAALAALAALLSMLWSARVL